MHMFSLFSYMHRTTSFVVVLFGLSVFLLLPLYSAVEISDSTSKFADGDILRNATWAGFMRFLGAEKGSHIDGMRDLKSYFRRFGYLPQHPPVNSTTSHDVFDDEFETAVISYQRNLGLTVTGKLDRETMEIIVSPRCGVAEVVGDGGSPMTTRRYTYFHGEPRWSRDTPMTLTYAISPENTIGYVSPSAVRAAFGSAFSRWAAVIPVNFTEADDYDAADIRIGWYSGDHGDGMAFDGVSGIVAHAFAPENGRLHLDAAETWTVDFSDEKSKLAVDLESVATHEIGHILGLSHSSVKEAIMYPYLNRGTKKVELRIDDIEGIQALYGSNPNYRYDKRVESNVSSGRGGCRQVIGLVIWAGLFLLNGYFIFTNRSRQ